MGSTSQALTDAVRTNRHSRDLLSVVSHDLTSPLTIITMSASFLLEAPPDPATREVAKDIVRASARMQRMLDDLLDMARIETGALSLVSAEHDVGALLREVSQSYRPLFVDRGLTFTVHELAVPVIASFDHDRFVQVPSNLCDYFVISSPRELYPKR